MGSGVVESSGSVAGVEFSGTEDSVAGVELSDGVVVESESVVVAGVVDFASLLSLLAASLRSGFLRLTAIIGVTRACRINRSSRLAGRPWFTMRSALTIISWRNLVSLNRNIFSSPASTVSQTVSTLLCKVSLKLSW